MTVTRNDFFATALGALACVTVFAVPTIVGAWCGTQLDPSRVTAGVLLLGGVGFVAGLSMDLLLVMSAFATLIQTGTPVTRRYAHGILWANVLIAIALMRIDTWAPAALGSITGN